MIKNKTLFNSLKEGGKIEKPIADGPFGSYFGMLAYKSPSAPLKASDAN